MKCEQTMSKKGLMQMKLPNGFGSVYKLSGNRRNPYRAIVTERWQIDTETGKWKQKRKTIGYYESKKRSPASIGRL